MIETNEIWQAIREARDARGWTNQRLSEGSGVPESSVQKILTGKTQNPSFESISAMCRALNVSLDAICGIDSNAAVEEIAELRNALEIASARTEAAKANERAAKAETDAKDIVIGEKEKSNNRLFNAVIVIGSLFVVLVFAVVGILVYDITHLDRGWFQAASAYYFTGMQRILDFFV